MYSDPAALKMYSEWVKIPEPITKRMRDEFYPKDELLPDRLSGLDAITAEAIAFKYHERAAEQGAAQGAVRVFEGDGVIPFE